MLDSARMVVRLRMVVCAARVVFASAFIFWSSLAQQKNLTPRLFAARESCLPARSRPGVGVAVPLLLLLAVNARIFHASVLIWEGFDIAELKSQTVTDSGHRG
jgi:hypothetical protein